MMRPLLFQLALLLPRFSHAAVPMVKDWQARLIEDGTVAAGKYKVEFSWEHVHDSTVVVDYVGGGKVTKPTDDPRCSGASTAVSPRDNQPFWMPRFNSRAVSANITAATGIHFASIDWQPCGHKDITICHAESHYDIHFYYVTEDTLASMPMCDIGTTENPKLPVCPDKAFSENHDYFKLVKSNLPKQYERSSDNSGNFVNNNVDFCVDPSSAILRSGVHYGDRSETLQEWKAPVTIVGSHDCKLLFFEPMVSWKWISKNIFNQPVWPKFEVKNIQYNQKTYTPLPDGWTVEVSPGCQTTDVFATQTSGTCTIKVTVIGEKCPAGGCPALQRECDNFSTIKDCTTNAIYKSSFDSSKLQSYVNSTTGGNNNIGSTQTTTTTSAAVSNYVSMVYAQNFKLTTCPIKFCDTTVRSTEFAALQKEAVCAVLSSTLSSNTVQNCLQSTVVSSVCRTRRALASERAADIRAASRKLQEDEISYRTVDSRITFTAASASAAESVRVTLNTNVAALTTKLRAEYAAGFGSQVVLETLVSVEAAAVSQTSPPPFSGVTTGAAGGLVSSVFNAVGLVSGLFLAAVVI